MGVLADLVQTSIESFDDALELVLFRTGDPAEVAATIEGFCAANLAPVEGALLYKAGVGAVAGLRLVDGRDVLLKVHRVRADIERLRAVAAVQAHLADCGIPAPRPLLTPMPLGDAVATIEEYVVGEHPDPHAPATRVELATMLHRLIEAARPVTGRYDVGAPMLIRPPGAPLYPEPHSVRFDFEATNDGAEWIDELARLGRRRLDAITGEPVIAHHDWRVENLTFRDGKVSAIYDWDSLGTAPEPVAVGTAAAAFKVDWTRNEPDPLPTLDEMRAFVEDYERARGAAFTSDELEALDAANLALLAYGARCLHSDATFHPELLPDGPRSVGWFRLLEARGSDGLTR